MLPIGEFRQPRSGPLMLLFANSLDGVRGGLVSGIQPAMGGLEGISRVGRTLGTPDAHPNLKEEPLWGQPPAAVRRSAAPLTVHYSCPPLKKLRWRTGVSARQGSSTGALPNSPHAIPNHVGGVSSARTSAAPQLMGLSSRTSLICALRNLDAHPIWKKNHVRAVLNCPPTNRRSLFKNTENPA